MKLSNMCSKLTLLCLALIIASGVVTAASDTGKFSSCCTRVSASKPRLTIVDFIIQEESLPCVEAVMFITSEGRILCSKPKVHWVTQKIKQLTEKKEQSMNDR
ncbi:C-C motif chemokine 24-like [Discoglossus pictus]